MRISAELRQHLSQIGQLDDDQLELGETALLLARITDNKVDVDAARRDLAAYGEECARRFEGLCKDHEPLEAMIEAFYGVLVREAGFHGDHEGYDDLENANLVKVLTRKQGLPVALALLYVEVGRRNGWQVEALNFPGHVLVRLEHQGQRVIVDPFHNLQRLDAPELRALIKTLTGPHAELQGDFYDPMDNRSMLLRLQNNIKIRLLQAQQVDKALIVLEAMSLIGPKRAEVWREIGLLSARLERFGDAINALECYLDLAEESGPKMHTASLLADLKDKIEN